jgi:dolichol-phosphate mannosyltransferase
MHSSKKIERTYDVLIVLPVFNEEESIKKVLTELHYAFRDLSIKFIVINDLSTDNSQEVIHELSKKNSLPVILETNKSNLGHGPSVQKGLKISLMESTRYILSLDSDGNFSAEDVRNLYELISSNSTLDVVLGQRINRIEPFFRKIISALTRFLVLIKTFKSTKDANTPLRIYRKDALEKIISFIPENSMVPNLHISIIIRKIEINFREESVSWHINSNGKKIGTTWDATKNFRYLRKILQFSREALKEFW